MQISIYDRFIRRQPLACMRVFINFFFKKPPRNYRLDFNQISLECSLDRG